jgi:hypothetical protein
MMPSHRALSGVLLAVLLCVLGLGEGRAQGQFGFGFIFGEPTGVAWKYRLSHVNAIDGAIGFSPDDRFRMHVDYLWQSYPFNDQRLALHYGVGGAVGFGRTEYIAFRDGDAFVLRNQDFGFGARTVIGLTYMIPRSPVDLFLEAAPLFVLTPDPGMGVDVGLGVRVYP